MHKFSRTLLLAGVLAFGTLSAACGDKVTVAGPGGAQGVQLVTVTPPSATIGIGESIILSGQVTADAASAKTVTWSTSNSAVASVDQTGKVTGVKAGTASITATSTADASKAASSVITVSSVGGPVAPQISISTVNQGGVPANLAAVANQLDVTLLATGGAGKVDLFLAPLANCASATIAATDVLVATQNTVATQSGPITLSFNTANVVNNAAQFANGQYCIKSRITTATGTATAANTIPLTLVNVNTATAVVTFVKTTATGAQNAISQKSGANAGLRFDQGDVKVVLTPIVYTGQTAATLSINYAGRTFTGVTPAAGTNTFTVTFPSTGTTAQNIAQYTSPASGDFVTVTSGTDVAGQSITVNAIVSPALRSDNQSPTASALAQNLNLTGAPNNWINASYSFATNNTKSADVAFATSQNVVAFWVGTGPATVLAPSTSAATCVTTGLTSAATGADLAQSVLPFSPERFVRVIETDPLGNLVCQDFGLFGVDKQNPNNMTAPAGAPDKSVIVSGQTLTYSAKDSVSGFTPGAVLQTTLVKNFITNSAASCVIGTFANSLCGPAATDSVITVTATTEAYYVANAFAQDQAGNVSNTVQSVYLVDVTAPTVGGIAIPQNLVGGASVTFASQAADNVDLKASNFDLTYSPATGSPKLFYAGDNYGPNYDSTRVTSAVLNATVPVFIQQLQATTVGGAPVAFAGADSGKAATVTVRAIDAANLVSVASSAAIPAINIATAPGFTAGTQFSTFAVVPAPTSVANNSAGTGTQSTTLTAAATLLTATPQAAGAPFAQVCYFYQQTATGNAADPTIPVGDLVQIACVANPVITDQSGVSRTWTYQLAWNPITGLGTAGTVNVYAVLIGTGTNAGVGALSQPVAVTLTP